MHPSASESEAMILARMITLKSALAGIPIGGAKTCIAADPLSIEKKQLIERLSKILGKSVLKGFYIPGTDMGFGENDLQQFYNRLKTRPLHTLHKSSKVLSLTGSVSPKA